MFSCIKVRIQKLCKRKACSTFPVLERKGAHLIYQMGESRILYVGIRESRRMLNISFIKIFRIPSLASSPIFYAEVVSTIEKLLGLYTDSMSREFFYGWAHINREISR